MLKKPDLNKPVYTIFPDFAELIKDGKCPTCKEKIKEEDFKDEASRKEFSVSGMCMSCQSFVFGVKTTK